MNCAAHGDRRAGHYCQKRRLHLCEECAVCPAPQRYCEYRSRRLIWNRDEELDDRDGAAGLAAPS